MTNTSNDVVVVTGGASGIGRAVVQALAEAGTSVVGLDRDENAIAAAEVQYRGDSHVHFRSVDIVDEAQVRSTIAGIEDDVGSIVGLVNSAGIGRDIPCMELSLAEFRRIIDINLIGLFCISQEVVRHMLPRGRGAVVNLASVSGVVGNSGRTAYGASKGGVITLTKVMALELAPLGVRVNAVAPGPIDTPMVAQMHSDAARDKWLRAVPQRRYGTPAEVAQTVLFLLDGDKAGYVTGQTLCVDGGFSTSGIIN